MAVPVTDRLMVPDELQDLHQQAVAVRKQAYAPYSKYAVGAALQAESGAVYVGANVENAAYPVTMCAERAALFSAVAHGERSFETIVIVSENGGAPCGACRQALSEFGSQLRVVTADVQGAVHLDCSLQDLLPDSFGRENLTRT